MTRFTTWILTTWNTLKNVGNIEGSFIGKAATIISIVGNAMSYFPGKEGEIGKATNH
jgi:hypothetical protein